MFSNELNNVEITQEEHVLMDSLAGNIEHIKRMATIFVGKWAHTSVFAKPEEMKSISDEALGVVKFVERMEIIMLQKQEVQK